mgnify:CR=1 FL=1
MSRRYRLYAEMFANNLECSTEEVEPYVYFAITTVTDYMIFGEAKYVQPQIELIKAAIKGFLKED